jgi:hypothetical protein
MVEINRAIRLLAKSFPQFSELGAGSPSTGEERFNTIVKPCIEFEALYYKTFREYPKYVPFSDLNTGTSILEICLPGYLDQATIDNIKSRVLDIVEAKQGGTRDLLASGMSYAGYLSDGTDLTGVGVSFAVIENSVFYPINTLAYLFDNSFPSEFTGDFTVSFASDTTGTLTIYDAPASALDNSSFEVGQNTLAFSDLTGGFTFKFTDIDTTTNISNLSIIFLPSEDSDELITDSVFKEYLGENFNAIYSLTPGSNLVEF